MVRAETVTGSPLGAESVTGKDAVPPSFAVVTSAMETDGGPSSSTMFPVAEPFVSTAFDGAESATENVSSDSSSVSPTTGTVTDWLRSPAAKVTVLVVAV